MTQIGIDGTSIIENIKDNFASSRSQRAHLDTTAAGTFASQSLYLQTA